MQPPEGEEIKSCGTERSGKRCLKRHQASAKKLNESKPTQGISKRYLVVGNIRGIKGLYGTISK